MRDGRGRLLAALGLVAVVALWWWLKLVRPGIFILYANSDLLVYYYPLYDAAYAWLAHGVVPLWNPYQLCGIPWLATLQGGFFYPGHVVYLLLPTHLAMAAASLLHFLLIALSMGALARRVGLAAAAAILAALLPVVRGALPQLVLVPNYLEAAAWLPLGAIAVHGLVRGEGLSAILRLALATALSWLAGCPQVTVYLLYAWGTLLLALLAGARAPLARWVGAAGGAAAAVGLGTLIAAVQLVPTHELTGVGIRRADVNRPWTIWPLGDERRLLPYVLSGSSASFGVVGVALMAAAIGTHRNRALALWAATGGALAFAFSMGGLTPLYRLYLALPVVTWFRVPSRILFLSDFCFAILVAVGVDAMVRPPAAGRASRLPAVVAIVVAGVLAVMMHSRGELVPALLAVACALALGGVWGGRRKAVAVVVALVVLEAFAAPGNGLLLPYDAYSATLYRKHESALHMLAERAGSNRVWMYVDRSPTVDLAPRLATRYGIRSIGDYETLGLRRQADYFGFVVEGRYMADPLTGTFYGWLYALAPRWGGASVAARRRLLDLAAVRFALFPRDAVGQPQVAAFLRDAGLLPQPFPDPELLLFENPHVLPRAFTVHRVSAAPPPERLLPLLAQPTFDPLVESFAEVDPGLERPSSPPPRGTPATIVRDEPHVVEVEATLGAPGLVVLADSFYPGWRATVDGREADIVPVNHLFRGVAAPAGTHRVLFEYRPASVRYGALISAVGLVLAGVAALAARR
jgi:hypothetical protein